MTVFVESLPKAKDYILVALPLWWGLGSALGGFLGQSTEVNNTTNLANPSQHGH